MDEPSGELLIHLHVPKCAGSSINRVLQQKFPGAIVDNQTPAITAKLKAMSREERDKKYKIVLGHWQWGVHRMFSKPAVYFSVMRPPVSRICSFYNYLHTRPDHDQHEFVRENLTDLNDITDDLMSLRYLRSNWSNYYCYAYSGRRPTDEASYISIQTQVLNAVQRGELLVGTLPKIADFLRERGILEGDLPRLNETELGSADLDFVPAAVKNLKPAAFARLQRWNRYDIRLLSAISELQGIV